jgi:hypothetical protein
MYDVIYEAEIALCNINKQPLQLYTCQAGIKKKHRGPKCGSNLSYFLHNTTL